MNLANRVFEIMDAQGKKQAELAEYLGVGRSRVNNWFHQTGDIPGKYLQSVCEFLGVSPQYLLTGEETNETPTTNDLPAMSEDESELLRIFHDLDREGRTMVLATAYSQRARMLSQNSGGTPSVTA